MDIEQRIMQNESISMKSTAPIVALDKYAKEADLQFTDRCVRDLDKDVEAMEKDYMDKCFALAIWNIVNTALIGITIVLLFTRGV